MRFTDSNHNKFVSIIDDELDIINLFHDALQRIGGITIFTFTDPTLALEHFNMNNDAYALVISDLRMPGLNGMELLKKIKDSNGKVRTLLMTAFAVDDKIFHEYSEKEIINGFLQKPIRINDLIKEAKSQLHAYESQKKAKLIHNK